MDINRAASYNNDAATFLIFICCLSNVFVPVFLLNKLIFAALFMVFIGFLVFRSTVMFALLMVQAVFIYGLISFFLSGTDHVSGRQIVFGSVALFLICFINNFKFDMSRALKVTGGISVLVMCGKSFLLIALPSLPIGRILSEYLNSNELGFCGVRDFCGLHMFMLHYRSTPFLLVALSLFFIDFLSDKKISVFFFVIVIVIVISVAIVCSAFRALMVMALVSLSVLYFARKNWSMRLLNILIVVPLFAFSIYILAYETSMFSSSEQFNSIKIVHLISFFGVIEWDVLLFGKALGVYFYTEGYRTIVSQAEIAWMDSVRFLGLALSVLLFLVLLFPARTIHTDTAVLLRGG